MAKKFPIYPKHPERICWGCDKYCLAEDLQCGINNIMKEKNYKIVNLKSFLAGYVSMMRRQADTAMA